MPYCVCAELLPPVSDVFGVFLPNGAIYGLFLLGLFSSFASISLLASSIEFVSLNVRFLLPPVVQSPLGV